MSMASSNFISAAELDIIGKATAVKEKRLTVLLIDCIHVHRIHVSLAQPLLEMCVSCMVDAM